MADFGRRRRFLYLSGLRETLDTPLWLARAPSTKSSAQGVPVAVKLRVQRGRCRSEVFERKALATQLPAVRRFERAHRAGYPNQLSSQPCAGGRPGVRLLKRAMHGQRSSARTCLPFSGSRGRG